MRKRLFGFALATMLGVGLSAMASAQSWTRVGSNGPPNAGCPLLLTDGRVMVHSISSNQWWTLTPDSTGSYINGTWKQIASMPSNYAPLYFASAVLKDGRVVVIGGEYNFGASAWTNLGAWYDPAKDKWTALSAPSGWNNIGDVQCAVMPDGRFFLASLDTRMASLDPSTMSWTTLPTTGKLGVFNEEGWTLMPNGTLLSVDCVAAPETQQYIPSQGKWVSAGQTPQTLVDAGSEEMGPQILMPNGKVIALGATGHNAVYTPGTNIGDLGTWTSAPDLPVLGGGQLGLADAPACLLPNGHVIFGASPGVFASSTFFFDYDGTSFTQIAATPNSQFNSCYQGNMLMLPSGQVMYTDFSSDVEIFTPTGTAQTAWKPVITSYPTVLTIGKTLTLKGKQLNGLSQCSNYGDDSSNATNYPLVRLTYKSNGKVVYLKTHDHSTMAVATGSTVVSTQFDVPLTATLGNATLEVVTNGIASDKVDITVSKDAIKPEAVGMYEGAASSGTVTSVINSDDSYFVVASTSLRGLGQVASAWSQFPVTGTPSALTFDFETSVTTPVQLIYFVYNWSTGTYDSFGNAPQTATDSTTEFTIQNTNGKYVSSQGKVKILLRAISPTRSNRIAPVIKLRVDKVSLVSS
ncbi:MAG: hypothetical protein JST12_17465 [Armatimonadetes bacterium]|nr:hypothetical protein [Armatimonadota bacterium]MBS1727539.1 hypothetical protein [Armatimonadota bacterium]